MATARRLWIGFGVQALILLAAGGVIAVLVVGVRQQDDELRATLVEAVQSDLEAQAQREAIDAFDEATSRRTRTTLAAVAALVLLGLGASGVTARIVARGVAGTESELSGRSAQLESTFQAMQDGVAVFDREANLVEANRALAVIHGYESADDMKKRLSEFERVFDLFDAQGVRLPVEEWPASRVLRGETYANLDLRVRRKDTGVERIVSYSARPVASKAGRGHAILVARDITDSLRAQREFDEQRHLLQAIFDAAPTLIFVKDEAGRFRVGNRALADLYGVAPDALAGRVGADFGRVVSVDDGGAGEDGRRMSEVSVANPATGDRRWFQRVELPLDMPGTQERLVLGIATDITERRRSEAERLSSETRLRLLIEAMPDAVIAANDAGTVVFASAQAERLLGYGSDELVGQPIEVLVPEARRGSHRGQRERYMAAPVPRGIGGGRRELEARKRDGSTIPVEVTLSPVQTPEGTIILSIVRDLSARKVLEEQLRQAQKMEAVGQLTGGIAHDLNNILTVIQSNAEMITRNAPGDVELQEDLAELLGAASRGTTMIQQLLHFSRRAPLAQRTLRPADAVHGLAPMLRRLLPENIQVKIRDSTGAADSIVGDTIAIEQMVVNLCTNSRDAMPHGGTLRIETELVRLDETYRATHPWVATGDYVCVSVSDDGNGMDAHTQERLFEPFFTTKPAGKGTGLGMAMVYGTMKQHGGMIHVYSELGGGTVVRLYFPKVQTGDAPPNGLPAPAPGRSHEGTEVVLVAEDEPGIRRATKRALEAKGYRVLVAEDGQAALDLFRQHQDEIDLVISDMVMPKMGGRQLAEALRAEGTEVKVLFTSGYSADTVNETGDFPEGVWFLQKPWTLDDLFTRVRNVLDHA